MMVSVGPGRGLELALATLIVGYFAHGARLPIIPTAPRVRKVQLEQLIAGLPWVARLLDLPVPEPVAR